MRLERTHLGSRKSSKRTTGSVNRSRLVLEVLENRTVPSANLGWALGIGAAGLDQANAMATDSAGDVTSPEDHRTPSPSLLAMASVPSAVRTRS